MNGLATLVAPNPLCASIALFRSDRTEAGFETLTLQVVFHLGPEQQSSGAKLVELTKSELAHFPKWVA